LAEMNIIILYDNCVGYFQFDKSRICLNELSDWIN